MVSLLFLNLMDSLVIASKGVSPPENLARMLWLSSSTLHHEWKDCPLCHIPWWSWLKVGDTCGEDPPSLSLQSYQFSHDQECHSILHTFMLLIGPFTNRKEPLCKGWFHWTLLKHILSQMECCHWYGCWVHAYTKSSLLHFSTTERIA